VLLKEFIQLRRDRLTFAMLIGVPILQLVLFGYAINGDPRQLPTAVVALDDGPLVRAVVRAAENTGYFRVVAHTTEPRPRPDRARSGAVRAGLSGRLLAPRAARRKAGDGGVCRCHRPCRHRSGRGGAASLPALALVHDLQGPLAALRGGSAPFELRLHRRYNPEGLTAYNVVPGLMGVILTMTLVMMTAMAMTRERERGTLENLLATPVRPLEMMVGKILPYVIFGYLQVLLIFGARACCSACPCRAALCC
jgi:ABC-2 type transport system permease protein